MSDAPPAYGDAVLMENGGEEAKDDSARQSRSRHHKHKDRDKDKEVDPNDPEAVKREFISRYQRLEARIDRRKPGVTLTSVIERLEEALIAAGNGTLGDVDQIAYFLRVTTCNCVQRLIYQNDIDPAEKPRVNQYFQAVIDVIIQYIPRDVTELLDTLYFLVNDPQAGFYGHDNVSDTIANELKTDDSDEPESPATPVTPNRPAPKPNSMFAKISSRDTQTSGYYVINVNYFGTKGGFQAILNRLNSTATPVSLQVARQLMRPLYRIRRSLTRTFWETYVPDLKDAVFGVLVAANHRDLSTDDKRCYQDVVGALEHILKVRLDDGQVSETLDQFNLSVGLSCFLSERLERRIHGLTQIRHMLRQSVTADEARNGRGGQGSPAPPRHYLKPAFLAAWLREKNVVGALFNSHSHVGLVRQSVEVLAFLADRGMLEAADLEMLWKASVGAHESSKTVIYEAIMQLSPHLSLEEIDALHGMLRRLSASDVDNETLTFASNFALMAMTAAEKEPPPQPVFYCLEFFWNLLQDDRPVSREVLNRAVALLLDLLARPGYQSQRVPIIAQCVANLAAHRSAPQSLQVLQMVVDTFPARGRWKKDTASSLLETTEREQRLLAVFMADLVHYKTTAAAIAQQQQDPRRGEIRVGKHMHMEHIEGRLNFLSYILTRANIVMTLEQVDLLWENLITRALVQEERAAALQWLESMRSATVPDGHNALQDKIVSHLFLEKMAQMDYTWLTPAGYSLFERYFFQINEKSGAIERLKTTDGERPETARVLEYKMSSKPAIGLNNLWEIALTAQDPAVFMAAQNTLSRLNANSARSKHKAKRELFSVACMDLLSHSTQAERSPVNELRIERCLSLLRSFVSVLERTDLTQRTHPGAPSADILAQGLPLMLTVVTGDRQSFRLTVHSRDRLSSLREKLAMKRNTEPSLLRIISAGRELEEKDNDRSLARLHLTDGQQIYLYAKAEALRPLEPPATPDIGRVKGSAAKATPSPKPSTLKTPGKDKASRSPRTLITRRNAKFEALTVAPVTEQLNAIGLDAVSPRVSERLMRSDEDQLNTPNTPTGAQIETSPRPESADPKAPKPEKHPLAREEYFAQVLALVERGGRCGELAWDLLMALPTNALMLATLRNSDARARPDWATLLTPTQPYRLIYMLQIIDGLVNGADKEAAVQWSTNFVLQRGVAHLISVLMGVDLNPDDAEPGGLPIKVRRQCVQLLLQIIHTIAIETPEVSHASGSLLAVIAAGVIPVAPFMGTRLASSSSVAHNLPTLREHVFDNAVDLEAFVAHLCCIVAAQAAARPITTADYLARSAPDTDELDDRIVTIAMSIVVGVCVAHPQVVKGVYEQAREEWLECTLLTTRVDRIREAVSTGIFHLSTWLTDSSTPPYTHFLTLLLGLLPSVDSFPRSCEQYFRLLEQLIQDPSPSVFDAHREQQQRALLKQVATQIKAHPIVELRGAGTAERDQVLIGLLRLATSVVRVEPAFKKELGAREGGEGLIDEVFHKCLFSVPTSEDHGPRGPPKCKSTAARTAAYRLLLELTRGCPANFTALYQLLVRQMSKVEKPPDWNFSPTALEKSVTGYVGLVNQGATCYMNALMQQFFLVPEFRGGILSAEDRSSLRDDSLLFQMQMLFAHLQDSEKRYYDAISFCRAYKDPEGRPINVCQQQDANEFLNILFDRLETQLKGSPQEKLMQRVFGGVITNQLICKECPHSSERDEPFFTLSVEVKNKKELKQALDLFVQGEMLEGSNKYFCATCQKGVDTLKRMCIKDLPDTLVLHLKRFEFDLQHMANVKVNDRLEFPAELNLEPYTREGLARRDAERLGTTLGDSPALTTEVPRAIDAGQVNVRSLDSTADEDDLAFSSDTDSDAPNPAPKTRPVAPTTAAPPRHRANEYYEYELVGILVHQGTADSGHYYSFIREREAVNGDGCQWFEYNDTRVTPFDTENIDMECFGGYYEAAVKTSQPPLKGEKPPTRLVPKANSAYMLVYERKSRRRKPEVLAPSPATPPPQRATPAPLAPAPAVTSNSLTVPSSGESSPTMTRSASNTSLMAVMFLAKLNAAVKRREDEEPMVRRGAMPAEIQSLIWEDNTMFLKLRQIFDADYYGFVWDFIHVDNSEPVLTYDHQDRHPGLLTVQLVVRFMVEILSRDRDKPLFSVWVARLKVLLARHIPACRWLLSAMARDESLLTGMLVEAPSEIVRSGFAALCGHAMSCLRTFEQTNYGEVDEDGKPKGDIHNFLDTVFATLPTTRRYPRNTTALFTMIRDFALLGSFEHQYLLQRDAVIALIDLYCRNQRDNALPVVASSSLNLVTSGDQSPAPFKPMILAAPLPHASALPLMECIAALVCSCANSEPAREKPAPTQMPGNIFSMRALDGEAIMDQAFLYEALIDQGATDPVSSILKHLAWENKESSKYLFSVVMKCFSNANDDQLKCIFQHITSMVSINDSAKGWRTNFGLSCLVRTIEEHVTTSVRTCRSICTFIVTFANNNNSVQTWLYDNRDTVNTVLRDAGFQLSV